MQSAYLDTGVYDHGVWQTGRYKHVAAAEAHTPCDQVRGVLVAPRIPDGVKQKRVELGVEYVELGPEVLTE